MVVFAQFGVAPHAVGHNALGLGVVAAEGEVEVFVVVEHAYFGALAGSATFDGFSLQDEFQGDGIPPGFFVQFAVDFGWRGGATGLQLRRRPGCFLSPDEWGLGVETQIEEQDEAETACGREEQKIPPLIFGFRSILI